MESHLNSNQRHQTQRYCGGHSLSSSGSTSTRWWFANDAKRGCDGGGAGWGGGWGWKRDIHQSACKPHNNVTFRPGIPQCGLVHVSLYILTGLPNLDRPCLTTANLQTHYFYPSLSQSGQLNQPGMEKVPPMSVSRNL